MRYVLWLILVPANMKTEHLARWMSKLKHDNFDELKSMNVKEKIIVAGVDGEVLASALTNDLDEFFDVVKDAGIQNKRDQDLIQRCFVRG